MIWLALIASLAAPQDGGVPYTAQSSELYEPPVVRPFEPPSDFGEERAEGDAAADVSRRPLTAPVVVNDYRHSYETTPTDTEIAYEQGVAQAELTMDSRSGPLDGRWRVTAADGAVVLDLVLADRGPEKPVEGAWRTPASNHAPADLGPLTSVSRNGGHATIITTIDAKPVELRLNRTAAGWRGVLVEAGDSRPVTMAHPG